MKLNRTYVILIAAVIAASEVRAWDSSENQIWLDGSVSGQLVDKLSLKLNEQIRYKDEGDLFFYRHTDLCTAYAFSKRWKLAAGFRHISIRKNDTSPWVNTEMYHINLINKLSFAGLDLGTRLRLCYTVADSFYDLTDFRPGFCLTPSKGLTGWNIRAFLADEIMYNLNVDDLYRNRVSTGLLLSPCMPLSLKIFIMQQNTKKTKDGDFNENFNYGLYADWKF